MRIIKQDLCGMNCYGQRVHALFLFMYLLIYSGIIIRVCAPAIPHTQNRLCLLMSLFTLVRMCLLTTFFRFTGSEC